MASLPTDYLNESTNLQVADTEVNIQVLKADGRVVPFHAKKIYKAIKKAERFLSEQNEAAADHDVDADALCGVAPVDRGGGRRGATGDAAGRGWILPRLSLGGGARG